MEDGNRKGFEDAVKNANLPQFDFDKAYDRLQEAVKASASIQHTWRQQGPYLICTSCQHEHAQWIGTQKKLTGFDQKGVPIIEPM